MTDFTEYTRSAGTAVADGLRQAKDINLASIEVLQGLTSALVPLSVSLLPRSEEIGAAIDTVVTRTFETVAKVVDAQYGLGQRAVDQLSSAAAQS